MSLVSAPLRIHWTIPLKKPSYINLQELINREISYGRINLLEENYLKRI
jgi:hypothetical protein